MAAPVLACLGSSRWSARVGGFHTDGQGDWAHALAAEAQVGAVELPALWVGVVTGAVYGAVTAPSAARIHAHPLDATHRDDPRDGELRQFLGSLPYSFHLLWDTLSARPVPASQPRSFTVCRSAPLSSVWRRCASAAAKGWRWFCSASPESNLSWRPSLTLKTHGSSPLPLGRRSWSAHRCAGWADGGRRDPDRRRDLGVACRGHPRHIRPPGLPHRERTALDRAQWSSQ
jgi:hypothetical protein